MKLRRPTDKLAGGVWLPRLVDKARHHFAGTQEPDFVRPFCHPLATDGAFLAHFEIDQDEILRVVKESNGDDPVVAAWFKDPRDLIEGTGKNLRHVKIRDMAQARKPAIAALLVEALADRRPDSHEA